MNKSIKNQYIALKEGKMTEAQFMRNVRMTLPQYISNVTLFKQAERILLNKGIISEVKSEEIETVQDPETGNFTKRMKLSDKDKETIKKIQALIDREKSLKEAEGDTTYSSQDLIKKLTPEIEKNIELLKKQFPKYNISLIKNKYENDNSYTLSTSGKNTSDIDDKKLDKAIKSKIKESLKEVKDTSATGYYNQDGEEQYSKFDELDNMNAQEIMAGYVMEKQDNPDIDKKEAVKLVIKNLKKDPFYYTNYKLTGVRDLQPTEFTTTKRKSGFDDMEEVDKNGKNFVDEKNKMTVIKEGLSVGDIKKFDGEDVKITRLSDDGRVYIKSVKQSGRPEKWVKPEDLNEAKEYPSELSVDNIKNIIKDNYYYYNEDKTTVEKMSTGEIYVSLNGDRITGDTRKTLENLFDVREESEEIDTDRLPLYTYFIAPKSTPDQDIPQKDDISVEDIFEKKDAVKAKLKEVIRKMMKEMFDGRDNLTDVE